MTKSKFFMFLTVLFFLSAVVFSQTITVTSPHSGDMWCKGRTYNITWATTEIAPSTNVKIDIFRNSIIPINIVKQLTSTNDGTESWPIPSSYATGTYYIRIKTADSTVLGDSAAFTIAIQQKNLQMQVMHLNPRIIGISPIENSVSPDRVSFQVHYDLPDRFGLSLPGHPVEYCLGAQVPNRTNCDHVYFGYSGCTQGIPLGNNKFSTIGIDYGGNPRVTEPSTYTSHTIEIYIWRRGSGEIMCSKIFNFDHTWHH